ncbi:WD40 repeat domain-containing protein [Nocardia sp. NPDC059246]|uniref:WD40 repeat domain-containing protein n=1 Tax=unclassified Nocardia TaxID=2637762 RepID=UPI0036C7A83B
MSENHAAKYESANRQHIEAADYFPGTPIGEPLTGHTGRVTALAFATTADGTVVLASGSHDTSVRLWDVASGTPIGEPLLGHSGWVNAVAFATIADGPLLSAADNH